MTPNSDSAVTHGLDDFTLASNVVPVVDNAVKRSEGGSYGALKVLFLSAAAVRNIISDPDKETADHK
jgi:hypothetical protein